MKLYSKTHTYKGHTITVNVHHDEHMGPPWEEHDGHGIVSDWVRRGKAPGELVLCSDRGLSLYYDYSATMKIAKKDGWGLNDEAALARKLGRPPTKGEIAHTSVVADYEYLRGWCNNEWHWHGYTLDIESPDGEASRNADSCWGYDDEDYMISEAISQGESIVDGMISDKAKEQREAFRAACADIATSQ